MFVHRMTSWLSRHCMTSPFSRPPHVNVFKYVCMCACCFSWLHVLYTAWQLVTFVLAVGRPLFSINCFSPLVLLCINSHVLPLLLFSFVCAATATSLVVVTYFTLSLFLALSLCERQLFGCTNVTFRWVLGCLAGPGVRRQWEVCCFGGRVVIVLARDAWSSMCVCVGVAIAWWGWRGHGLGVRLHVPTVCSTLVHTRSFSPGKCCSCSLTCF